ncbi:MAG: hypothetical protein JNN12_08190 [Bacteroidetes Order II. Incertae sedis bacterium]|nr:hypothetical protein [Bacteroidetes Order II. bacterium]
MNPTQSVLSNYKEVRTLSNNILSGVLSRKPLGVLQQAKAAILNRQSRHILANSEIMEDRWNERTLLYKEIFILLFIGLLVVLRAMYS